MTLSPRTGKLITAGIFTALIAVPQLASAGQLQQQRVVNDQARPQSATVQVRDYTSTSRRDYSQPNTRLHSRPAHTQSRDRYNERSYNERSYDHGPKYNRRIERQLEEVSFQIGRTRDEIKRLRHKEAYNHNPRLRRKIARLGQRLDRLKDERRRLKKRRDQYNDHYREADYQRPPQSRPNYNAYRGQ